jgi:hypothetical protein
MDIAAALQIVIDLARQNVADQLEHPDHFREQQDAINMVEDMAVNQFGDDETPQDVFEPDAVEAFDRLHEPETDGWFVRGHHQLVAELHLSGSHWIIGYVSDKNPLNDSLFIKHEDSAEATYLSALEGTLLMSAIVCAQTEVSSLLR